LDLTLALVALIVSAWSAYTAAQARRHNESPQIDVRFVRARPWLHEHESTNPWKDPAIRITNDGPHDYDMVKVSIVQSSDEMISARSSPIISMFPLQEEGDQTTPKFGKQQSLGPLQVGQFIILGVVTNPAAHGAHSDSPVAALASAPSISSGGGPGSG